MSTDNIVSSHQQKNLFHQTYRARVCTKPLRSLPPVLPDLLSPVCLSSPASSAPGRPTFSPKRPTCSLRPYPLPAPSCCICPLIFLSTGLLPTLTNRTHWKALPDLLAPLGTEICPLPSTDILHCAFLSPRPTVTSIIHLLFTRREARPLWRPPSLVGFATGENKLVLLISRRTHAAELKSDTF